MATALVVGCAVTSVTLWYYSRRYVGELSLLRGGARSGLPLRLCFSVLDFWGRREVATGLMLSAEPLKNACGCATLCRCMA